MHNFYTGVSTGFFEQLLNCLGCTVKIVSKNHQKPDLLFIVLIKSELALTKKDVACRFGINFALTSRIYYHWLTAFARFLRDLSDFSTNKLKNVYALLTAEKDLFTVQLIRTLEFNHGQTARTKRPSNICQHAHQLVW